MRRALWLTAGVSCALAAIGLAACVYSLADPRPLPSPDGGTAPQGDAIAPADATTADGAADATSSLDAGCPPGANESAYVVSEAADLYRFTPPSGFSLIGHIGCDAGVPWDMAIEQDGTAWVVFQNGGLYRVSTIDAHCTPTGYSSDHDGFLLFGMAFARVSRSSPEVLYVSDTTYRYLPPIPGHASSNGVATIDTKTLALTPLGKFIGEANLGAELTGGNGQLYAFFPNDDAGNPSKLAALQFVDGGVLPDPTGAPLPTLGVPVNGDFAFLYWQGGFWLFTALTGQPSTIWHYASSSLGTDASAPFPIIGAGVSTCAQP